MANLGNTFDSSNVDTTSVGGSTPIPRGRYSFILVNSEDRASKANPQNRYLACEFKIIDGQYSGRKFFKNFNLWNANEKATQIAIREFANLCKALNKPKINDSNELHNIPGVVDLDIETNERGAQNKVKQFVESAVAAIAGAQLS